MAKILLLSNGHGEDISGAVLGQALHKLNLRVEAFPIVGIGSAYIKRNINVIGRTREFSTGGIGYTSLLGRLTEIFQGQFIYLFKRLIKFLSVSPTYDLILVIGDIVPVFFTWLSKRPSVAYLVAYSSHYEGKLKMPWPCNILLDSKLFLDIYTRDQLTAQDLTDQLNRKVEFIGNPFMDPVLSPNYLSKKKLGLSIGILPGSRRPELEENLILLLRMIEFIPLQIIASEKININLALVNCLDNLSLSKSLSKTEWDINNFKDDNTYTQLVRGEYKVNIYRNSFSEVLQTSDLLIAMAGTASEQAVGLSKPVLQMPGKGPQFTEGFADAQRRLLGSSVFCAQGKIGSKELLRNTADLAIRLIKRIKHDSLLLQVCKKEADLRIGSFGAASVMSERIKAFLKEY